MRRALPFLFLALVAAAPVSAVGPFPLRQSPSVRSCSCSCGGGFCLLDTRSAATSGPFAARVGDPGSSAQLAWSPDGTSVAFERYSADRHARHWCCQLILARLDGTGVVVGGGPDSPLQYSQPAIAADGWLVFVETDTHTGASDIWTSGPGGRDQRPLTRDDATVLERALAGHRTGVRSTSSHMRASCGRSVPTEPGSGSSGKTLASAGASRPSLRQSLTKTTVGDGVSAQARPFLTSLSCAPDGSHPLA